MKPGFSDIAYFVDGGGNYEELLCVSLYSLAKAARHPITAHVFYSSWSPPSSDYLWRLSVLDRVNGMVRILPKIMPKKYDLLIVSSSKTTHLGPMCCARFLLPKLLEERQCLYVDCDTLFLKDPVEYMKGFYGPSMANSATAGVKDIVRWLRDEDFYTKSDWYVNSGVLLMDLDLWRSGGLAEKCMFDALVEKRHFVDQDALNFIDRPLPLPAGMNFMGGWLNYDVPAQAYNWLYGTEFESLEKAAEAACIVHYTGETKPLQYMGDQSSCPDKYSCVVKPYREAYFEYKELMERNKR